MLLFVLETALTVGGMILGGQAIKLGLKWVKYGAKRLSPPDDKKKEEPNK